MKKYIVSKKHKSLNYVGASVVSAAIMFSVPTNATAEEAKKLSDVDIIEKVSSYDENYKIDKVSSKKITQELVDTPQTIQVISEKLLVEQQATTLQEALRNTPGITLNLGENGNTNQKNNIMMRGFDTQNSIYKDGVRLNDNIVNDMFNTEAIEITKGAVGADNGRGVASGYINQVTKKAKLKDDASLSAGYNTGDNVRLTSDINKKLNDTTAIRVNMMKHEGDVAGRDIVEIDRTGFAATVDFGISTETRTQVGYEYFKQNDIPDGGIPTIGLPSVYNSTLETAGVSASKVDRENFYGSDTDFEDATSHTFLLNFEHDFSPNSTISNITKYNKTKQEMVITALFSPTITDVSNSDSWTVRRLRNQKWQENENIVNKTNFNTNFDTGSISHTISTGIELIREEKKTKSFNSAGDISAASVYNPNSNDDVTGQDLSFSRAGIDTKIDTVGAYAFDSIELNEQFMIIGGGRIDRYEIESDGISYNSRTDVYSDVDLEDEGTLKSWKLGFVYKPLDNGSIYLSYASSELPPGGQDLALSTSASSASDPNKDPEESDTIELGTKWEFFDDRLSLTSAIYKTLVSNQVTQEDDGSYTQEGDKEVKGIEIGVVGQLTNNWSMSAGIAKDKTDVKSKGGTDDGAVLRFTPDWSATLWTTYDLTSALKIGGGTTYTGNQKVSSTKAGQDTPIENRLTEINDFLVFDLMSSYAIDKHSSLQLNVYNVFDEEYVANTNKDGFRYTPGKARQATLTYTYKF